MSAFAVKGPAEGAGRPHGGSPDGPPDGPHGGPVRGLPWAVLRLHRTALTLGGVFLLAALGALVWEAGIHADSVRERIAACDQGSALCRSRVVFEYGGTMSWASTLFYYSFFAVAAFAGGALIGRELENGTAYFAWTQSVSPTRWLAAKLAVPALLLVVGGTVFVFVFRWAWAANRDLMGDDWTFNDVFAARGPAVVAYGLCGLGVGALAGVVLRRALPALGAACGVMYLLNHNLEVRRENLWPSGGASPPESHYWPVHLVETGIVLGVAGLATGAAFWVVRRRTG